MRQERVAICDRRCAIAGQWTVDSGGEKMVQWTVVLLDNLLGYTGLHRVCKPVTNGKSRPTACIFIVHGYHRCVLLRVRRRTFSREFTRFWTKFRLVLVLSFVENNKSSLGNRAEKAFLPKNSAERRHR